MDEAFGMATNEQAGWKKRKTPNLAISHEASTASSTPVASTRSSRNKPAGTRGPGAQGQRQITHLEDVITMMAWAILTMKQKMGALRCGANFVVILRDNTWKQKVAEVSEGWCTKQQEKDDGSAHPWACSKRGAAFGCVISLLNKAAVADTLSVARITDIHPGWTKVGFAEMAKCKPAVWDSVLGSFKQIHPKYKEDKPWTWVASIRSDAPAYIMDQFRANTSLHTEGVITIAAERENKQSKSEEQLWKWLKNRSKTA